MRIVRELPPDAALLADEERTPSPSGREDMAALFLRTRMGLAEGSEMATMRGGRRWFPQRPGLQVNWSRRGAYLLVAAAEGGRIGADLELVDPAIDAAGAAAVAFSPRETAWLLRCPADARIAGFYRIWCGREAWLKAMGLGVDGPEATNLDLSDWLDSPEGPFTALGSRGTLRVCGFVAEGRDFVAAIARLHDQ